MRRIEVTRDAVLGTNEPVVSMHPSDYRKLLAVARAADEHVKDCHNVSGNELQRAVAALNAKTKGRQAAGGKRK